MRKVTWAIVLWTALMALLPFVLSALWAFLLTEGGIETPGTIDARPMKTPPMIDRSRRIGYGP